MVEPEHQRLTFYPVLDKERGTEIIFGGIWPLSWEAPLGGLRNLAWSITKAAGVQPILRKAILTTGMDRYLFTRPRLSYKYLRGTGLEIGAMHAPLPVRRGVQVKYVDICTREESIRKFPELDPAALVQVDYVTDGFRLEGVPEGRFDFLAANHVLEHSPDPVSVLATWLRVLRPGGYLFLSVPRVDRSFDRGRILTKVEHILEDHRLTHAGGPDVLAERNRAHYEEWVRVSLPAIEGRAPESPEALARRAREFSDSRAEIHFHTFSESNVEALFRALEGKVLPELALEEIAVAKEEIVIIARKVDGPNHPF